MALVNPNIVSEQVRKRMKNKELPDSIISYIFSKLDTKNMVKTSILSKRWQHEWLYMKDMDFSFDMRDMFDIDQIASYDHYIDMVEDFGRIVDQCISRYKGSKIRSLRMCFSYGNQHSYCFIGSLISHVVAKGVERIELLLFQGYGAYDVPYLHARKIIPKCDSLKYLHLQQCDFVLPIIDFTGFKNLQTLVLQQITLKQEMLLGLFSNCIHLVNLTLKECYVKYNINIISPKLCHLVIIDCKCLFGTYCSLKITVDAVNLSSFEYSCPIRLSSIKAPRLIKFFWGAIHDQYDQKNMSSPFDLIAGLHQLKNLVLSITPSHVARLLTYFGPLQNVRQLVISIYGEYPHDMGYLQILDIVMASPNLQKLVLTISHPHLIYPDMATYVIEETKHLKFSHSQLKFVELRGCIGTMNGIELARHFLKNVNSLKQITFNPRGRFYIGAEKWSDGFECSNCMGRMSPILREQASDFVVYL